MATLLEIRERLDKLTEHMTARVLTYNAGVFGTVWAISTSDNLPMNDPLIWAAALSLLSFSCDILQFACAYLHQRRLEHKAKISTPQEAKQSDFPILWRLRYIFFDAKLVVALASTGAFIVGAVILALSTGSSASPPSTP